MARWVYAALLVLGTMVWALGKEDHGLHTAELHADADYYYVYLPSLLHGDLDFTDEYRETKNWYHLAPTPTGRPGNVFGIGPAVLDAPVFLATHAIARIAGARADGFSTLETWSYTYLSLPWTLAAMIVAGRLIRRRVGSASSIAPVLAALAGPVVYYAIRQPGYAHPLATFWVTLLVERWDASYDEPRTLRTWLVLGAVAGAAALARPQLAMWSVLLAAAAIDDLRRQRSRRLALHWAAGAAAGLLAFAPQLVAWKVMYGAWYVVPQGPGFMRWDAPCWSEVLFSSRNGLFPWAPAYVVLAIALAVGARRVPRLAAGLAIGFALQTLANGAVWDWWAGGSYGGRRFDSTYVVFAVGAALLVAWIARELRDPRAALRRWQGICAALVATLVTLLVGANIWLMASYTTTSARIFGGQAASEIIAKRVPAPMGTVAAWMSSLSNLPARAAFAWKHGTTVAAYDRLVGVHVLGETYPGLNAYPDTTTATIPGGTVGPDGKLVLFVGLNRTGSLEITVPVGTAMWNREPLHGRTSDLVRGINELEIDAPPGTVVPPIQLHAITE